MGKFVTPTAEKYTDRQLKALEPVIALYPQEMRARVLAEAENTHWLAERFDHSLEQIIETCVSAKEPREISWILRRARGEVLEFLYSTTLTLSVLRLSVKTKLAEARAQGFRSAADTLLIEQNNITVQELARTVQELTQSVNSEKQPMSGRDAFLLVKKTLLVPRRVSETVTLWSAVPFKYARAQKQLFTASTRSLRLLLLGRLWQILWGISLEYWGICFGILCALIFGIVAWALGLLIPGWIFAGALAVVIYLTQMLFERAFRGWHLDYYGRLCIHTVLDLYAAQIRARSAMLGLEQIAGSEPSAVRSQELIREAADAKE